MPDGDRTGPWIQCWMDVEGRHVDVAVRQFDDDERRRVAAKIAWFAETLLTSSDLGSDWSAFLQRTLTPNVSLTLDEQGIDEAPSFWEQVFCRTFEVLLLANGLTSAIRKHLHTKPLSV